jgi:hypothetical protein
MRSRNRSVKLPNALMDAGERRAEAIGYGSFNAYIAALIRYDLMVRGAHHVTLPVARMKLEDQDAIDDELLRIEESGEGARGVFLEHLMERVLERGAKLDGEAIALEAKGKKRNSKSA